MLEAGDVCISQKLEIRCKKGEEKNYNSDTSR